MRVSETVKIFFGLIIIIFIWNNACLWTVWCTVTYLFEVKNFTQKGNPNKKLHTNKLFLDINVLTQFFQKVFFAHFLGHNTNVLHWLRTYLYYDGKTDFLHIYCFFLFFFGLIFLDPSNKLNSTMLGTHQRQVSITNSYPPLDPKYLFLFSTNVVLFLD